MNNNKKKSPLKKELLIENEKLMKEIAELKSMNKYLWEEADKDGKEIERLRLVSAQNHEKARCIMHHLKKDPVTTDVEEYRMKMIEKGEQ